MRSRLRLRWRERSRRMEASKTEAKKAPLIAAHFQSASQQLLKLCGVCTVLSVLRLLNRLIQKPDWKTAK